MIPDKNILDKYLNKNGYVICSDLNTDIKSELTNIGAVDIQFEYGFKVDPFQPVSSMKKSRATHFHTDGPTIPSPLRYIAIYCVKQDPKHPFYGRNQIVRLNDFKAEAQSLFSTAEYNKLFSYGSIPLISKVGDEELFRLDPRMINDERLKVIIEEIGLSVCDDFVLETGQMVIIDNWKCLHRRGECTVKFNESIDNWESREILTYRFNA